MLRFTLVAFAIITICICPAPAQQTKTATPAPPAPIPAQIAAAKKAFIANGGGECSPLGDSEFSGGPDVAYKEFYAGVKKWGRFSLVNAPADADLVMEVHFTCPAYFDANSFQVDGQIRIVFLDPKTRMLLWAMTQHSQVAKLKSNRDKEFGIAMSRLLSSVQSLVLLAADQPDPNK